METLLNGGSSMKIRKNDFILFFVTLFLLLVAIMAIQFSKTDKGLKAQVYVKNQIVFEIELETIKEPLTYIFEGKNGDVEILFSNEGVKVISEISPYHLCSRQKMISKSGESLICLPNDVYVKIVKISSNEVVIG